MEFQLNRSLMIYQLKTKQLSVQINPDDLGFTKTSELSQNASEWLCQSEAHAAARFGLKIHQSGFNLMVIGELGSGRRALMESILTQESRLLPVPDDLILIYNFDGPEKPLHLYLKAGRGIELRLSMDRFIRKAVKTIPIFLGEGGSERNISEEAKQAASKFLEDELTSIQDTFKESINKLSEFSAYLAKLKSDALENIEVFLHAINNDGDGILESFLSRYRVNLLVDNRLTLGAPAIVDDDPSFQSLFGGFESMDSNSNQADFLRLRAGNLLRANEGYLMLYLRDIQSDQQNGNMIQEKLLRFLRNGHVLVEDAGGVSSQNTASHFAPEALPASVKIILIATRDEYYSLMEDSPDFISHFPIKVDFAESMDASRDGYHSISQFIANVCHEKKLLHFDKDSVGKLITLMHRKIEHQLRFSTDFSYLKKLVVEIATVAQMRETAVVGLTDVNNVLLAQRKRHDYPERKLREAIMDGELMITLTGSQVGQINGLTHIDMGDVGFGSPIRISARCSPGDEGVVNIDREIEMTGPNHDKGLFILKSWFTACFSRQAPLALNATLVFEQEYQGVEGDSATCAELYALLSAVSGVPIKQGIAVTGAMNQHGELMAVGGLNEKVEGYFRLCQKFNLDGSHGVIIPRSNQQHLVLDDEVIHAVENGLFHIYAIQNVDEGIPILMDKIAGDMVEGSYTEDSVFRMVQQNLEQFRKTVQLNQPINIKVSQSPSL